MYKADKLLRTWLTVSLSMAAIFGSCPASGATQSVATAPLQLTRPVRPWEFLSVLGRRSAVLGLENGSMEAWVYPLKLFRDFHVNFLVSGRVIPGDTLLRSIEVRPESATLVYVADTFSVRETIFVPRSEPSLVFRFDLTTAQPLEVQVSFHKDLQWMWPAPTGDTEIGYVPALKAFVLDSLGNNYSAIAGSPTGHDYLDEYETNSVSMTESSVKLGAVQKGTATQYFAAAASFNSLPEAEALYRNVLAHAGEWERRDAAAYATYIDSNLKLQLPDARLQQAYEWAQVSMLQMLVDNPLLGTGLVAGFDRSSSDARPGYAWFFGRDALWTSFALNAEQDFATTKTAIEFLAKYQRADGKVPHEIAQGASFVPWFTKMGFAYASADATPLFIIAVNDYVQRSGDVEFARQMWDHTWRAYQFLLSTYDQRGFAQNQGIGHGWIEGGPLYPLHSELYQNGLASEALRSLSQLANALGRASESQQLAHDFAAKQKQMEDTFWIAAKRHYALAVNANGELIDVPSVLSTVPMWFGLLDPKRVDLALTELSGPEQQTDWGMRILSAKDARFDPGGYHFGTVWPLFTGWASVAEFRYHHPLAATQNLQANALLTFDGSLGHVAEVLSGTFYSTSQTASPNQLWSSAMVVAPLVRGMLGLEPNALDRTLGFTPHVPADWTSFKVEHLRVADAQVYLAYSKTLDSIDLDFQSDGGRSTLIFSPALSLRAKVRDVLLDGKHVPFHIEANADDQHVVVSAPVTSSVSRLTVHVQDEFGITEPETLPQLGSISQGVHVLSQTWSTERDTLTLQVAELTDKPYELGVWNPREIASVEGAEMVPVDAEHAKLRLPASEHASGDGQNVTVVIHFTGRTGHHSLHNKQSAAGVDR